jgi:hypothetical protein
MESLAEETIPMVTDTAIYYRIQDWMKNVAPKSGKKRSVRRGVSPDVLRGH